MFGKFNIPSFRDVSFNRRLELLKHKPKSPIDITLRIEKLSGKCILEKENDLVLRNLVRVLYALFANYEDYTLPSITVTDVGGNARTGNLRSGYSDTPVRHTLGWFTQGDLAVDTCGIVIGSGTTAPSRTDYALVNKIPHGTGTGQIYYNRQTYELLTDYSFRLNREFTNAGSDLSVAEAGLIYNTGIGGYLYYVLLIRDTFTPVSVTAGNGIRVRYTFSF
jgi:hypothetical protein